jgi:methylated-DNA-[protein]-cysteine S-methyltransferase
MTEVVTRTLASPIGTLTLFASADALVAVDFPNHEGPVRVARTVKRHAVLDQAARELTEYFAGARQRFDVELAPEGTPFQRLVWDALYTIPFAATWSYGQLAATIRRPSASRAVGAANGRNPIPIIIPCHRVIGASGALTGFGGGLPTKQWLLGHESRVAGVQRSLAL